MWSHDPLDTNTKYQPTKLKHSLTEPVDLITKFYINQASKKNRISIWSEHSFKQKNEYQSGPNTHFNKTIKK